MSQAHAPHEPEPSAPLHGAGTGRLHVSIVTPEGLAFEGEAAYVVVPGHDGEVAFFPLHAAYVGALGYGELRLAPPGGAPQRWFLEGGVAEVAQDNVTVLAERVLAVSRIDVAKTRAELARAVASVPADEAAEALREQVIRSAQARLRVAGGSAGSASAH